MMYAIALALVIGVPVMAVNGRAYRGVYAAAAVVGAIIAFLTSQMFGAIRPQMSDAERAGQEFINNNGPAFAVCCMSLVVGGVLGALLYREK